MAGWREATAGRDLRGSLARSQEQELPCLGFFFCHCPVLRVPCPGCAQLTKPRAAAPAPAPAPAPVSALISSCKCVAHTLKRFPSAFKALQTKEREWEREGEGEE